jgi:dolichyl-phosphate beta-glucosyltransferase
MTQKARGDHEPQPSEASVDVPNATDSPAPSLEDQGSLALSLVIPAFNEEDRLPRFLETVQPYMTDTHGDGYEVIVVDDGSRDRTAEIVDEAARGWPQLRLLRHAENRGKGGAVKSGVLDSRARLVLFADADGATPISEEAKLRSAIAGGADVACGSRLLGTNPQPTRRWHRRALGRAFAALVQLLVRSPLRDTQCGFKMFRGPVARDLFRICPRDDYLFDIFILLAAKRRGCSIAEVSIPWQDVPGSRLHLLRDSLKMAAGLLTIRRQVSRLVTKQKEEKEGHRRQICEEENSG